MDAKSNWAIIEKPYMNCYSAKAQHNQVNIRVRECEYNIRIHEMYVAAIRGRFAHWLDSNESSPSSNSPGSRGTGVKRQCRPMMGVSAAPAAGRDDVMMMRTAEMIHNDGDEIWKSTGDVPSALGGINNKNDNAAPESRVIGQNAAV